MEEKRKNPMDTDKDIVFSKAVKAGKRIYYLDVKKNRKDDMFLSITESKKVVSGEGDDAQVNFEKHKIFLYKEDFEKFTNGLQQSIQFIVREQGPITTYHHNEQTEYDETSAEKSTSTDECITKDLQIEKIDIEF